MFFIESSGRTHLTAREACSIESAVSNTGLGGHIVIAMTSKHLDVNTSNATCHLYSKYNGHKIFFRHVNVDTIFWGTHLHHLHKHGAFAKGLTENDKAVHYR